MSDRMIHAHFPPFGQDHADPDEEVIQEGFGFDPEKVTYSETGGAKDNRFKPPVDLLPVRPLLEAAKVAGYGARKYERFNWRRGLSYSDQGGSIMRHILAWLDGEDLDPESGLHHLAHAATQSLNTLEFVIAGTGEDDRWHGGDDVPDR